MVNAMVSSNGPGSVKTIDSIQNVPYRIGYSFRQPQMIKTVTKTRERPYFAMDWAIKGPSQVKEELYQSGVLQRYPTVWRRAAKTMNIEKLNGNSGKGGVVGNRRELPNFQELGEAPGPTDKATTSSEVTRSDSGFLNNMIKMAGGLIDQSQKLEIMKAQAQATQNTRLPQFFTAGGGGLGMVGWVAILGTVGVGAFLYIRNR